MTHTPGPWKVYDYDDRLHVDQEQGRLTICRLACVYDNEAYQANARLIAAAPDLLAALEDTAYVYHCTRLHEQPYEACNRLVCEQNRAAIAKARQEYKESRNEVRGI